MQLHEDINRIIPPDRVLTRPLERYAYANDASFYRLVPQAVVQPASLGEIRNLMAYGRSGAAHLTFRAAGTSLSGQAITDGILVDISKHWSEMRLEDGAAKVRLQPGIIGGHVNRFLRPHGRRFGPDPASIDAAMVGGILANNSSGMCCGVVENAYKTLDSLHMLLADGTEVDTAAPDASRRLLEEAPEIHHGLLDIRDRISADPDLVARIRRKYSQKNTTGYSLNAFIDFQEPIDILSHLMIGSEGTLGFIAGAVLHTLPDYPFRLTGLLFFPDVPTAGAAIIPLRESGARALEIMDRAALRSIENLPGCPPEIASLGPDSSALLVEYQCQTEAELADFKIAASRTCPQLGLLAEPEFTTDPTRQTALWSLRKGMIPSIGAMRPPGTSVLIEDVAFPIPRLANAIGDLQALFRAHGYDEAVIFGHAKDGNLHFVITQSFSEEASIRQFNDFMQGLVELVVDRYDGALKAEHGTGRNVSAFVAREWGDKAYGIMKEIKHLFDPEGYLNPDVLINTDPLAHVKDLKTMPIVESEVDRCIECGFCESHCPSRRLTLTPRQRIVLRRAMAGDELKEKTKILAEMESDYRYAGLDTCAADGLCQPACPVKINTGDLVKRLRAETASPLGSSLAERASANFKFVEMGLRSIVSAAHGLEALVGPEPLAGLSRLGEHLITGRLPKWNRAVPHASRGDFPHTNRDEAAAVYFPACITRIMGRPPLEAEADSLITVLLRLAEKAGLSLWIPPDIEGVCCGMPFSSKGYTKAYEKMLSQSLERFWEWTDGGRLPLVIDASSCAYSLLTSTASDPDSTERRRALRVLDPVEFAHDVLLPRLEIERQPIKVVLHPNCALRKMNGAAKMITLAQACAREFHVPANLDCCGFAGDRGLLFPELTSSATELEAAEVLSDTFDGYYSSNLTCEMGMALATGKPYRSILYLLDQATGY